MAGHYLDGHINVKLNNTDFNKILTPWIRENVIYIKVTKKWCGVSDTILGSKPDLFRFKNT